MPKHTQKEIDDYCNNLLNKFKQNPDFDLEMEFGKLLMINIDDFTPEQRKRYDELKEKLCKSK